MYAAPMSTTRCAGLLLSVDPGLRACGVALWRDGELLRACAIRGGTEGRGPDVWRSLAASVVNWVEAGLADGESGVVLVETMKVYAQGRADPADLVELAGVSGAIVGRLGWRAEGVRAAEWNGQLPSPIRRNRTREWVEAQGWNARVNLDTTARFQQDVWSAVGIGRWRVTGHR